MERRMVTRATITPTTMPTTAPAGRCGLLEVELEGASVPAAAAVPELEGAALSFVGLEVELAAAGLLALEDAGVLTLEAGVLTLEDAAV